MLLGYVIAVDYGRGRGAAGTWPGGRCQCWRRCRDALPREDARFIYLSYTLLAELRYFEQVPSRARRGLSRQADAGEGRLSRAALVGCAGVDSLRGWVRRYAVK